MPHVENQSFIFTIGIGRRFEVKLTLFETSTRLTKFVGTK